jgi:hypothetical protein
LALLPRERERRERGEVGRKWGERGRGERDVCVRGKVLELARYSYPSFPAAKPKGLNPLVFLSHLRERKKECVLWFLSKGLEPRTLRLGARTEKGNNSKKERRRRRRKRRRHGGWVMKQG